MLRGGGAPSCLQYVGACWQWQRGRTSASGIRHPSPFPWIFFQHSKKCYLGRPVCLHMRAARQNHGNACHPLVCYSQGEGGKSSQDGSFQNQVPMCSLWSFCQLVLKSESIQTCDAFACSQLQEGSDHVPLLNRLYIEPEAECCLPPSSVQHTAQTSLHSILGRWCDANIHQCCL